MGSPYIGEIRMFAGNYAPAGWAICDGSLLSISENDALFVLIGTTYGGDGQTTFALPDLRGRVPIHQGNGYIIGQPLGTETVTLTINQLPIHTHGVLANSQNATETTPSSTVIPASPSALIYNDLPPLTQMNSNALSPVGGNQPHENRAPYLAINFIISLFGIFPTPT